MQSEPDDDLIRAVDLICDVYMAEAKKGDDSALDALKKCRRPRGWECEGPYTRRNGMMFATQIVVEDGEHPRLDEARDYLASLGL